MRKLFSILAVAMTAISLNATVVTKNPDLSQFSNYGTATVSGGTITDAAAWAGAQSWEWLEGISAYDQIVITLEDHDQTVLFKVIYSDETSMQVELPAGTNIAVIDLDPAQNIVKGIQVLNWSNESDIDITITDLFFRGAIGIKKNITIWSGTKTFEEFDWANRLLMAADKFADLHVGDILEVYYTTDAQSYHQFEVKTNYDNNYPSFAPAQVNLGGSNESGVLRFYIAENSDLSNISSQGGLYLNGKHITFTKVSVIKHEVLWTGTTDAGNWSGYQEINASKLANLKVGNIICVRLSDLTIDGESQVALYDGSWTAFSPEINHVFQEGDVAPMTVEFPVTYKMEQQLRGKNLLVRGKYFTMTDIYVKEGTPATTVAAYLNVSAAGMATYVLPFNVPALPDGVEAYTLTNNGDETIWATPVDAIEADKPVLIVAAEGEYEFISEVGASDDISSKTDTYANGALIGTYTAIDPLAQMTGGNFNYVLNNQGGNVAFYQVRDNGCSVAPYRAYLSCCHDASNNGANFAPRMRIVFRKDAPTGVDNIQGDKVQSTKVFENGVLYIKNNGIKYNVQGQLCK